MSTEDNNDFKAIVDLLVEGEGKESVQEAVHHLLMENAEQQIVRAMGGDRMPMNYLMKFEEFLDDHDLYLFKGWDKAWLAARPKIDRFWTTFLIFVPQKTDLRGAIRVRDADPEHVEITGKKVKGGTLLKFKVLKRVLDAIEKRNQEKAEKLSDEEMEYL